MDAPEAVAGRRQGRWLGYLPLTAYWLGLSVHWGALTTIVVPRLVEGFAPPAVRTTALALVAGLQALVSILVQPLSGGVSDHVLSPWGRRRPLMVVGVAAQLVLLLLLAMSGSYLSLLVLLLLVELASNTAQGPYQGLLPDNVEPRDRGTASGMLGAAQLVGQIAGVAIAGLAVSAGRIDLAIVAAGVAVGIGLLATVRGVPERAGRSGGGVFLFGVRVGTLTRRHAWLDATRRAVVDVWGSDVLARHSYLWLLASRLAILMATSSLQAFVYFYLAHAMGMGSDAAAAVLPLSGLVALVAVVTAVPGGAVTARLGRVRVVWLSALLGAAGAALFAVAPSYGSLFLIAIPFGAAIGIFLAADWALLADVVPPDEAGRYLGLSNTVTAGAGLLSVVIAGPIADVVNQVAPGAGYRAVFVLATLEFLVGAWCVRRVPEPAQADLLSAASSPPPDALDEAQP